MADWLSSIAQWHKDRLGGAADAAMSGLRTAKEAVSGARYLVAPDEFENLGDLEEDKLWRRPFTSETGRVGVEGATAAERQAQEVNRPKPKSIYESVAGHKPGESGMAAVDLPVKAINTAVSLAGDPLQGGVGGGPSEALSLIGVGTDRATKLALRENLIAQNAKRAADVFAPAGQAAWRRFSENYPRLAAHLAPSKWDEAAQASEVGQKLVGGYAHLPGGSRIGGVRLDPTLSEQEAFETLLHEGTHGGRAVRAFDRGRDWMQDYQQTLKEVGYKAHPEEAIANKTMESGLARDAIRQLRRLMKGS